MTPARMRLKQAVCNHDKITIQSVPTTTRYNGDSVIDGECKDCEKRFKTVIKWEEAKYQFYSKEYNDE